MNIHICISSGVVSIIYMNKHCVYICICTVYMHICPSAALYPLYNVYMNKHSAYMHVYAIYTCISSGVVSIRPDGALRRSLPYTRLAVQSLCRLFKNGTALSSQGE